jgi:2-polyprenyl-6-methoxyphenol hydroxylase-like FAD-dependent oxidoreductase
LPDERVYWFVTANAPEANREYADEQAEALRRVQGWHDPIPELIRATPPDQVLHNDLADIDPLASFVKDRVVLLGDAAHAMTPDLGQGACQAIEDAVVLAASLNDNDLEAGLAEYDRVRRARVQPMTAAARASVRRSSSTSRITYSGMTVAARLVPPAKWRELTARWSDWQAPKLP